MENVLSVFREYGRLERMRENGGLSIADLERWTGLKRMLARHFRPDIDQEFADKQASLRVPSQLRVRFESYGRLRECLMTNISRGGVFVATDHPLPIGTPFKLHILIDESNERLEIAGEVASVNTGADLGAHMDADMKNGVRGMGIRFCNLDEDQQAVVDRLYGRAMVEAMQSVS